MDLKLKDKTAIITGGASGLGRETAHYFAAEGMRVVLADRDQANIDKVLVELRAKKAAADGFVLDVRNYASCVHLEQFAEERFGSVDVLVACAGITGYSKFFLDSSPEDWDPVIDINVRGVMNVCRAVAPGMVVRKSGSIINIGSEAGKVGEKRMVTYSATKGAVISFTKALSVELGRYGVRANAVCPGVTHTPMTADFTPETVAKSIPFYPLGRLGQPADIAAMITFLASDQSSWVTGQAYSVSGGFGRS